MAWPADTGPILPWEMHDRRHPVNPFTGKPLYMLDRVGNDETLRYCRYCDHYVHPRKAAKTEGD